MTDALARRGPDGAGLALWAQAALGHRRLAIFDLSDAGRQPMLTEDRAVGVVFNGAIYNFKVLRDELRAPGCRFHSDTDTEVLLHGYLEWGIDELVERLRGMFAFGLWDERAQRLFLVRDRLGVKPLVYAPQADGLAFASTVRALRIGGCVEETDAQAVAEFLEFGFVTDDRTIYRGAYKVPAASIVEWSGGQLRTRQYWAPPMVTAELGPSFNEAVEQTEHLLLRAVEMRLQADVPVGALLSSGVDSSLICWAITQLGGEVTAYTVGTPGDAWDETADARQTARQLGIAQQVLELSENDAPDVDELVSAYGEPFACASALGMLGIARRVAQSATVLLTGDGGDDVFLGYPEHLHLWRAQNLARWLPELAADKWQAHRARFPRFGLLRRAASFINYTTGGLGAVARAHDGWQMYEQFGMLGERLADLQIAQRQMPWSLEAGRAVLTDFLAYDRRMRFVGEYLTKIDGATMHHALEARSPFLDQELWEFAAALPYQLRLRGGRLKAILRELARRRIGARVAYGRKRGFGVPVQRWIAGRWRGAVEESLRDSQLAAQGWIKAGPALARLARAAQSGWGPKQLWYLYVLETWLRRERALTASGSIERAAPAPALASSPGR